MASPIPKRQMIDPRTCDDYDSEEERSDLPSPNRNPEEATPEEIQQFYDEWNKSQGFEIDFSKLTYWSICRPVNLDGNTWVDEPETDRDFIAFLAKAALTKLNAERGTSLELGKILMANCHLGAGVTFNISFEVNDPSEPDGNQTKPYRAVVGYMGRDNLYLDSCDPKPSP